VTAWEESAGCREVENAKPAGIQGRYIIVKPVTTSAVHEAAVARRRRGPKSSLLRRERQQDQQRARRVNQSAHPLLPVVAIPWTKYR
jgi:hypothetical protein